MSSESESNKELVLQYVNAYNTQNQDRIDDLFDPGFVRHSKAAPEVYSREDFKEALAEAYVAFPDGLIEVETMVAEADKVVTFGTFSGTQTAPYGHLPATGKRAEIPFFYLFRIEDGRIAEFWTEWDNVNFMIQLGHFPSPSG